MKVKLLTILSAVSLFAFIAAVMPSTASAQEAEVQSPTAQTEERNNESEPEGDGYTYTAQVGDSYTVLVRKAVQTYGLETETNLSGAQIVFAETNLTLESNSPELNEGQQVTIPKETVKQWVDRAKELSDAQQAAWEVYVPFVNFNTDEYGEA